MDYDRRISESLVQLLAPGQALSWMVTIVRSPEQPLAHVQFRRATGVRPRGGIQLYLGRTSPLEVRGYRGDRVELQADDLYRQLAPELFGRRLDITELAAMSSALESHVHTAGRTTHRSFLDGEAISHAGMMRRYGPAHHAGDPLLAVDSEVRVGFGSMAERNAFENDLRARLGLTDQTNLPKKLDTLGILTDGSIGLVEVKEERGNVTRAAVQAAAHVHTFGQLIRQDGYDLVDVLTGMAMQKESVGLLPAQPTISPHPQLVPIIAAPDERTDWFDRWRRDTEAFRTAQPDLLHGVRFWRLSKTGDVLDERHP